MKILYGPIITSVPIFYGQDTMVLTELCMALEPLPALKGDLIAREGQKGYEMYCIDKGVVRVTVHKRVNDDVTRVKTWIEETLQAKGSSTTLFDSNLRVHLEQLVSRMRLLAKKKKIIRRESEAESAIVRANGPDQSESHLTASDVINDYEIEDVSLDRHGSFLIFIHLNDMIPRSAYVVLIE